MKSKLRLTKSAQEIGFLLEDIEQDIEECKKIIETKYKRLAKKKKKYCREQKIAAKN